ncbi:AMP-dependent synthetase/ligase domain-containing protein [Strongyloides ratti]|uniref:long-chain-fatty-acid--CoA ligase n=1 Tax=Strongyloides ratti TaxID=34506 RepID=A0A090KVV0_STRRB|nr:AMP-dependent synthetase/ligase domain-containing protein [Strongyloides ratti]CEF59382.1 AMP-dependent synthetase/ligase domain-containing protein [Strongyloides ratti]
MSHSPTDVKRIDKILEKHRPQYLNVVYIPFQIFANPEKKLQLSERTKAIRIDENDPTSPFRHVNSIDKLETEIFENCPTLGHVWDKCCELYEELPCFGTREIITTENEKQADGRMFQKAELGHYEWMCYGEVDDKITNLANAFVLLDLPPKTHIVIFAETRAEWMITAQACFRSGYPVITVYATLGEEAVTYAIKESEGKVLFTTTAHLDTIKKIRKNIDNIEHVIYFEDRFNPSVNDPKKLETIKELKTSFKRCDLWDDFEAMGSGMKRDLEKVKDNDICMIMYTSGTTGNPKGVVLTHKNIIAAVAGQRSVIPIKSTDIYIGYLPLAHILEVCAELVVLSKGCRIGYSSAQTLFDRAPKIKKGTKGDTSVLRPTLMACVPAVMDRIFKAVTDEVSNGSMIFKELFRICYERRRSRYEDGYSSFIMNKLAFNKIKKLLGGKLRVVLSGGAPLNAETQRFMNICFCCPVVQGYGLTETCGGATLADVHDLSTGSVGPPLTCCEIMLREWSEANYSPLNDPPQGEILIHGSNVCEGYYKNPEKTKEEFVIINGKRYFCTGDIGEIRNDGSIKIIDRKKDLIKLSHGEYISLGKVETSLLTNSNIDNICVYGNSHASYLIALIVPNEKNIMKLAEENDITGKSFKEICSDKTVNNILLKVIQDSVKGVLTRVEIPAKIYLCNEPWTPASGLLTEALKLKRKVIENHYKKEIESLYNHN